MTTSSVGSSSSKIDGLVSGLDTTSIINAIMAQAALPQSNLKAQLAQQQLKLAAYQSINTKMASLQSAADTLANAATWQTMAVTSSSSAVSATAGAGAQPGSFTFDVSHLATYQTSIFSNTVASTSAQVVTAGTPVTITDSSGNATTIDTGDGSLAAVVAGINKSGTGVQATAVQVSTGQYKLQLSSTTTGAAAAFTVGGISSLGSLNDISTAQDAQITVGAGSPGAYTVSSSTNTFSNVLPGLTFTVSELTTGVTLATSRDDQSIADKVQAMVDAANAVLDEISNDTAYNTTTNTASTLTGDSTVARLRDTVLSSMSAVVGGGLTASSLGLSTTKDGHITFDEATFKSELASNPQQVQDSFGPSGSFAPAQPGLTGTISLIDSSDSTAPGSYDVKITQAATKSRATVDTSSGLVAGQTITLGSGSASATYTVQTGDSAQNVVDALNSLAASNGVSVNAVLDPDGTTIDLSSNAYGSQSAFTVSAAGGLAASGVTAGLDVAGTINGQQATGVGQVLYTDPGTPGVDALTLNVTLTPSDVTALAGGSAGSFTFSAGFAQQLASIADRSVDTSTGTLTNQIDGVNSMISDLNNQIASWQVTLDTKRTALEMLWANLESQLSNLKAQGDRLSSSIASLPSPSKSS